MVDDDGDNATIRAPRPMGYQPGLDGLRAISVVAVILYHAGFRWMSGGFFGVEVFFVVSGYLITSLLLDEREQHQRVSLRGFWMRRARRLFPALATTLIAVASWALLFGSDEQRSTLRRDLPWSIFYLNNWGQITGSVPYFASADPPLLRHLWSLAVEEQWYIVWPLVFVGVMAIGAGRSRSRGVLFIMLSVAVMVATALAHGHASNNALYLSTLTRSSGLLLGAGCAFVWRPWRTRRAAGPDADSRWGALIAGRGGDTYGRWLDPIGAGAVTLLVCIMAVSTLGEGYVSQWLMAVVSVLSMVAIGVVVNPAAVGMRAILSAKPLVEIGRRSYGLYLWHWPIFVIGGAYHSGDWVRFGVAMVVTVAVAEVSFRYVETPIRRGAIARWLRDRETAVGADALRRSWITAGGGVAAAALVATLGLAYQSVDDFDAAVGGDDVSFELDDTGGTGVGGSDPAVPDGTSTQSTAVQAATSTSATTDAGNVSDVTSTTGAGGVTDTVATTSPQTTTTVAASTTLPNLPRRVVIVGDSQAHSLAVNLPNGIGSTFTISDGSVEGCGVYESGKVRSARQGFSRSFTNCGGFAAKWGRAASGAKAEVALVVLGAWDVFDLDLDGRVVAFASAEADAAYLAGVQDGIDALVGAGAHVALLEVPCMRPQDVKGAGVPALPERGDDARVAHVNDLLRQAAAANPDTTTFVTGPAEWCGDESISTNLGYRWDGVHVYKPGANLIYETIAPALLAIPL